MRFRASALTVVAVLTAALLSACNPNSESGGPVVKATIPPTTGSALSTTPASAQTGSTVPTSTRDNTVVDHFGPKCDAIPTDPSNPQSYAKLGNLQAAVALSRIPLTGKTYAELTSADMTTIINTASNLTILAPSDAAWQKLDQSTITALNDNKQRLTRVLSYHVIPRRLSPDQLSGTLKSLEGATVKASGSKPDISVSSTGQTTQTAHVVCGNIITQNATVYVIDTVLMPPTG